MGPPHTTRSSTPISDTPTIKASELEPAVWKAITEVIYNPDLVIQGLEEEYSSEKHAEKAKRLTSVEEQMQAKEDEPERWNQAYAAGYLDLKEWGEKKLTVEQELAGLNRAAGEIRKELTHKNDLERQTQVVLTELASLTERALGKEGDLPFKIKRKIIGLLIDDIVVNGKARTFELRGVIRATRSYGQDFELVFTSRNT